MSSVLSAVPGGLLAFGIWAAGGWVASLIEGEPRGLRLLELSFEDGQFHQKHAVYGSEAISGEWTAQISRDGVPLCQGGGAAPYVDGQEKRMTPDLWTDDLCPALIPGDLAVATWEFKGGDGLTHSIKGTIIIPEP